MSTEEKLEIKSIRKCFSLTQKELADILGVKQASVCRWEQGKGLSLRNYLKLQQFRNSSSRPLSFCDDVSGCRGGYDRTDIQQS
ncbi:helix-turn-helix transcriptional regulator [Bartonella bilalgolemii]|uniref:Helix-turn-helix domain-containing protein n=1 Tax=Bartonella bilalgolemii TaxID=2942911 RepID=A0ABT0PA77_9HYPH|nr:helix-turn-helix domain-containing protein [Bartonella sp. G70]MCL6230368.1 helix-turn-helix domain-containing protein [Bartonella sp. G70]